MRVALCFSLAALAAGVVALADRLEDTFYVPLDDPAIQYAAPASDTIARLEKQLESGKAKLDYAPNGWGYLPARAEGLDINIDSQVLVFSRTSIQTSHISPRTPRAIYFNDDTAVGFVQGGDALELTGHRSRHACGFSTRWTLTSPRSRSSPAATIACAATRARQPWGFPDSWSARCIRSPMPRLATRTAARSSPTAAPIERALGRLVRDGNARRRRCILGTTRS